MIPCCFTCGGKENDLHVHTCQHKRCKRKVLSPYDNPAMIHAVCRGPWRNRILQLRGLGDLLAWIFAFLGIYKTPTCNCDERQVALNNLCPFPWKQ